MNAPQVASEQPARSDLRECPQGCGKTGLRGETGVHMHVQRAHKQNWSTKRKG